MYKPSLLRFCLHLQVFIFDGGWQTVAAPLLAATFYLPRLPKHYLWPIYPEYYPAVWTAVGFLAPLWPEWWQRWLACGRLVLFLMDWAPQAVRSYRNKRAWRSQCNRLLRMSSAAVAAARAEQVQ
jgi:hypothetical protein